MYDLSVPTVHFREQTNDGETTAVTPPSLAAAANEQRYR